MITKAIDKHLIGHDDDPPACWFPPPSREPLMARESHGEINNTIQDQSPDLETASDLGFH